MNPLQLTHCKITLNHLFVRYRPKCRNEVFVHSEIKFLGTRVHFYDLNLMTITFDAAKMGLIEIKLKIS